MQRILVANRSEIAIRVFRAAAELGIKTVAVFAWEDRFSLHRFKADEAYQIGHGKGPVAAYLDIQGIVDLAKRVKVDAIHPGYGFLSENANFARACRDAGITFIGPPPEVLELFGDKVAARKLAIETGLPVLPGTEGPVKPGASLKKEAKRIGFPLIMKASFGGGGRGMRVVHKAEDLEGLLEEARREAGSAFGNDAVFLERYVPRAKHIEVQVLGDVHGEIVHLWERDCSVQRRHQKVVEIAPAPNLDPQLREALAAAAVALVSKAKLVNAATVEFLVDVDRGEFYFIEVNPRIQVEHTVTEMVTGIDLVRSQILVAQGLAMHEPPIGIPAQDKIETRGYAMQCRVTTEDPENKFTPDIGRITHYRSPAGFGIRLDGGTAYSGAVITPYYDSLLVKVTAWSPTFDQTIRRMDRALREFRVRGVKVNIPFLENVLANPHFAEGKATTTFIDTTPELVRWDPKKDRATKVLTFLGEIIVNGNPEVKGRADARVLPEPETPVVDPNSPIPPGSRDKFKELGPEKFARWVMSQQILLMTDTTFRDAHQSLLATRVRTVDLVRIAPYVARHLSDLFSIEMWGGATFDSAMRFLKEDPWERLTTLRQEIPNILFQMLLRAGNAVGYTNYPDSVVAAFVKTAAANGIDVFRVFDCFNWIENMRPSLEAVLETGRICEGAICYTGDLLDPKRDKYPLEYYVKAAKQLEKIGVHILGIKDMAGLCKPYAAHKLVKALREEVGLPIHFHTHDTAGVQAASILKASEAGVHIADSAISSMSGLTSQPNLNSLAEALRNTERETGLNIDALNRCSEYWESVREIYYPFESGMRAGTSQVYQHEIPGGQITNLREQATKLGLSARWREILRTYADVNHLFGDIVKVTPSSKVVGDMTLFLVANNLKALDVLDEKRELSFPKSVIELMEGRLGHPHFGWPKKLQQIVLKDLKPIKGRPSDNLPAIKLDEVRGELKGKIKATPSDNDLMSYLMYPREFVEFEAHRRNHGDTSMFPSDVFFFGMKPSQEITLEIEPGKTLIIKFQAVGEPDLEGGRPVFFELNGVPRQVRVQDRALKAEKEQRAKADPDNASHIAAPMPGKVVQVLVSVGQQVSRGQKLLGIEAMKMETSVYSPIAARVKEVTVTSGTAVASKDLLIVLDPIPEPAAELRR
ncbi:MAG TPA: pyruvate carboxylase [Planctomycetota bacterium]|nr:pyruvate carboxylase [Planctomycetota bacterium]